MTSHPAQEARAAVTGLFTENSCTKATFHAELLHTVGRITHSTPESMYDTCAFHLVNYCLFKNSALHAF